MHIALAEVPRECTAKRSEDCNNPGNWVAYNKVNTGAVHYLCDRHALKDPLIPLSRDLEVE